MTSSPVSGSTTARGRARNVVRPSDSNAARPAAAVTMRAGGSTRAIAGSNSEGPTAAMVVVRGGSASMPRMGPCAPPLTALFVATATVLACASSPTAPSPTPPAAGQAPAEAGFTSLFNGRDLDGWTGAVDGYEVRDGAIVCKPGQGGTLFTRGRYRDFVVRLEFKLPPAGNNGLAIRYPGSGDAAYVGMTELQVLDDTASQVRQPRSAPGARLGLRHGRVDARTPQAGRPVERAGSDRPRLDDQGRAERHDDPRYRPRHRHDVHGRHAAPRQGPHRGPLRLRRPQRSGGASATSGSASCPDGRVPSVRRARTRA